MGKTVGIDLGTTNSVVAVMEGGEPVVISTAEYERLLEADEDAEDLAASDAVMNEIMAGNPTIPWAKVKADLGLS